MKGKFTSNHLTNVRKKKGKDYNKKASKRGTDLSIDGIDDPLRLNVIAINHSIRELTRLNEEFGSGRWRKLKGNAYVELWDNSIRYAEIHWYQAHGIGKVKIKVKNWLD